MGKMNKNQAISSSHLCCTGDKGENGQNKRETKRIIGKIKKIKKGHLISVARRVKRCMNKHTARRDEVKIDSTESQNADA
jgi:hypothetical protein